MQNESQTGNTGDTRLRGPRLGAGEPFLQGDTRLRDPHSEVTDLADKGTLESSFQWKTMPQKGASEPFSPLTSIKVTTISPAMDADRATSMQGFFGFSPSPPVFERVSSQINQTQGPQGNLPPRSGIFIPPLPELPPPYMDFGHSARISFIPAIFPTLGTTNGGGVRKIPSGVSMDNFEGGRPRKMSDLRAGNFGLQGNFDQAPLPHGIAENVEEKAVFEPGESAQKTAQPSVLSPISMEQKTFGKISRPISLEVPKSDLCNFAPQGGGSARRLWGNKF